MVRTPSGGAMEMACFYAGAKVFGGNAARVAEAAVTIKLWTSGCFVL
jgi:hypothetical protein